MIFEKKYIIVKKTSPGGGGTTIIRETVDLPLSSENVVHHTTNGKVLLDDIINRLNNLEFVTLAISSFSTTPNRFEIGSTVTSLTWNWQYNKPVTTQSINGENINPALRTMSKTGLSITTAMTYTLSATDSVGVKNASTVLQPMQNVYWGTKPVGTINSAFVLSLPTSQRTLQNTRAKTFTVTAGFNDKIWYFSPKSYGLPVFEVGGFEGGFSVSEFSFTNASGYTEIYYACQSDLLNLGATTVTVK
jgi:hypothetical protein